MKLAVLSFLLAAAYALPNPRVTNGNNAEVGQIPYQASLQQNGFHFCGGTLINDEWVLTAAHCLVGSGWTATEVVLGETNFNTNEGYEQYVPPASVHCHPEYSRVEPKYPMFTNIPGNRIVFNDICLIKLSQSMAGYDNIAPAALPAQWQESSGNGMASGWGSDENGNSPAHLQYIVYPIIDDDTCRNYFGSEIKDHNICAGNQSPGQSVCSGDSGGPLICSDAGDYVCGVVSWGTIPCHSTSNPNVYTQTSHFIDWIEETIAAN